MTSPLVSQIVRGSGSPERGPGAVETFGLFAAAVPPSPSGSTVRPQTVDPDDPLVALLIGALQ